MRTIKKAKERTTEDDRRLRKSVEEIIDRVLQDGDSALREYNEKFDGCSRQHLRVSREEIEEAYSRLSSEEIADLKTARANIEKFAAAQRDTVAELKDFSRSRESFWDTGSYRFRPAAVMSREEAIRCILQR